MLWECDFKREHGRYPTWEEKFNKFEADGVDFVPCNFNPYNFSSTQIICSFTREQMIKENVIYPRSSYIFWKKIGDDKTYLIQEGK